MVYIHISSNLAHPAYNALIYYYLILQHFYWQIKDTMYGLEI